MTEIIKVDPLNPDPSIIKYVAEIIVKGGLVAFPTETVYGLGADTFNSSAVKKIFEVKGRPIDNPLIVHVSNLEQLERITYDISDKALKLIDCFWPGPLTLIFKRKSGVPPEVSAYLPTIAVRMPANPIALSLINESKTPIAAPSANISSKPSPTSAEHVIKDLYDKIDIIIDGGETLYGVESTILNIQSDPPKLLRPGAIPLEEIEKVVGCVDVSEAALAEKPYQLIAEAPGMKYRHYAPMAPMFLVEGEIDRVVAKIIELAQEDVLKGLKVGVLATSETCKLYPESFNVIVLGSRSEPYTIAHNLFKSLRLMDDLNVNKIYAEGLPMKGILFAVQNRLRKASGHNIIRV
ncbi:MAG: L-threonylcarbamoyladenylate synthase [Nitrososphaeria archaeon]|nr:L-threonylcarbamoyladenylate synthase [Nitrososphaeria archaeon]